MSDLQLHPVMRHDLARRMAELGLAIFPINPTVDMLIAGSKAILAEFEAENGDPGNLAEVCWRAMTETAITPAEKKA